MAYIELDHLQLLFNDLLDEVDSITSLKKWVNSEGFLPAVEEILLAHDIDIELEDVETRKLKILDDLIAVLNSFENELGSYQNARFKNLEQGRQIAGMLSSISNLTTQRNDLSSLKEHEPDLKTCKLDTCNQIFVAMPPTKEYCCPKHRELAKKRRQRSNEH